MKGGGKGDGGGGGGGSGGLGGAGYLPHGVPKYPLGGNGGRDGVGAVHGGGGGLGEKSLYIYTLGNPRSSGYHVFPLIKGV